MICPECNGTKGFWRSNEDGTSDLHDCPVCGGKGVVEPLTNEEWLDTLNTEEKAKVFANESKNVINDFKNFDFKREHKEFWEMWLKQPHREE